MIHRSLSIARYMIRAGLRVHRARKPQLQRETHHGLPWSLRRINDIPMQWSRHIAAQWHSISAFGSGSDCLELAEK